MLVADRMNSALKKVANNKQISKKARVALHKGVLIPTMAPAKEG